MQAAGLSLSRELGLVHQRCTASDQDGEVAFAEHLFPRAREALHPAQDMGCVTGATGMCWWLETRMVWWAEQG